MKTPNRVRYLLLVALCSSAVFALHTDVRYAWSKDAGATQSDQAEKNALTAKTWQRVRAHVVPDKQDLVWTKVGWHPTLWDAVIAAHKERKPILLWAMNGHALACT